MIRKTTEQKPKNNETTWVHLHSTFNFILKIIENILLLKSDLNDYKMMYNTVQMKYYVILCKIYSEHISRILVWLCPNTSLN